MGSCQSSLINGPSQSFKNDEDRDDSDMVSDVPLYKSFARVGSTIVQPIRTRSMRVLYSAKHRASNYNHVSELVERNISSISERNGGDGHTVGVVGLQNLGNTCFMNSSMQCLSNTIPLTDYFLGYDYKGEINKKNFLGTKGELATAYADILKKVWLGSAKSIDPHSFKSKLEHFAPQFQGYAQHDTQEFLAFLLDGIHEDLNRVVERPYIEEKDCDGTNDEEDSMLAWGNYLKRNKSIIVDLFQGQLKNTLTCRNNAHRQADGTFGCGHKNIKFEPFMYLSLPISKETDTLDDCMKLFCREESLTGADRWYCPKCKEHVVAAKKFDLWTLPPILIVHLKRFNYSEFGARSKINTMIRYPLRDWDLFDHVKSAQQERPQFDLYAVSNHYGDLGSGHYVAHALNRVDDEWYQFNDSKTKLISQEVMAEPSGSAYCLFYNRSEPDNNSNSKTTTIRRQSAARPDLWPHMQVSMDSDSSHGVFKNYRRSPSQLKISSVPDSDDCNHAAAADIETDKRSMSLMVIGEEPEQDESENESSIKKKTSGDLVSIDIPINNKQIPTPNERRIILDEDINQTQDEKKCEPMDDLAPTPFDLQKSILSK